MRKERMAGEMVNKQADSNEGPNDGWREGMKE